jgi:lysophospholipase L1-like esterase
MFHEATELLEQRKSCLDTSAAEAHARNVLSNRGIELDAVWLMNMHEVLFAILWQFMVDESSPRNEFRDFIEYVYTYHPHFQSMEFVAVTNGTDRVFTSGLKFSRAMEWIRADKSLWQFCPGNDLYGRVVKYVAVKWASDDSSPPFIPVKDMLVRRVLSDPNYSRTIAVLSDSLLGFTSFIQGGDIFYRKNITCGQLAQAIYRNDIFLNRYHVVIICIGTNDNMNLSTEEERIQSHRQLMYCLAPLGNVHSTQIIFNTGIGVRKWHGQPEYNQWFIAATKEYFATEVCDRVPDNLHFIDWSHPGPDNLLMDELRFPDVDLMCTDGGHPNHYGHRYMLKRWIETYPPVGNVNFCFSEDDKYPAGEMALPEGA